MPTRTNVAEHFDARARAYDENRLHCDLTEAVADWLKDRGETEMLDVATGTGLMIRSLLARRPMLRAHGVDISAGMLGRARQELSSGTLVLADATKLPFPDSSVDLITCITALHLMPDPVRVAGEWARVLRPGGRAVTATFAAMGRSQRRQPRFRPDHDSYRTPRQMSSLLGHHGLAVDSHREWLYEEDHWWARLLLVQAISGRARTGTAD